jgi:ubiquinone biosynthesis protein
MRAVMEMKQRGIPQEYFSICEEQITFKKRKRAIVRTFTKYGLSLFFRDGGLALFRNGGVTLSDEQKERMAKNLRMAFQKLGPTFIKFGQVLSTRQDILPDYVCDEFTLLLDRLPPAPFHEIATILERELPDGMATFRHIDPIPIGSASLATVYRAQLADGRWCAVKVVRPNIEKLFHTDISIIKKWARRIYKRLPERVKVTIDVDGLLENYWSSSMEECDMRQEAQHMEHHRNLMTAHSRIRVPEIYLQPTKNVLVMELIDGWSLKEFPVDSLTFEDRFEIMFDLAHYYIDSFLNGYYHADPHASNILIDKHTKQAVVIDWGMVGRMNAQTGQKLLYLASLINQNLCEEAAEVALSIVEPTEYTDVEKIRQIFYAQFPKYAFIVQGQSDVNWGTAITEIIRHAIQHYCRIPSGLALWTKGWMATEATARWLLPEINYNRVVESYDTNILKNILRHQISYKTNGFVVTETAKLLTSLPRRLNNILEKLSFNTLGGFLELRMSEGAARTINRMVNREVIAKVASSSLIASGLFGIALNNTKGTVAWIGLGTAATITGLVGVVLGLSLLWKVRKTNK